MNNISAAQNVANRLRHMRQFWEAAAKNYFTPESFQLSLQSCITTSRTVTFILQSNKSEFKDFDEWYATYQTKWGADPIMRWAKEARNSIEKKGDLKTHSQFKASLVASYLGRLETPWTPQSLFSTPLQILHTIPAEFLAVPQIREHGTLVIERRWIDSELPNKEVLEALVYVYGQFVTLLLDLFARIGAQIPQDISEVLPHSMQPLVMDRAIYLSIKDGSEVGLRLFKKPIREIDEKALRKRYKNAIGWKRLSDVSNFRELCDIFFANACGVMLQDGYHGSLAILFTDLAMKTIIAIDHPSRASRYVIMRDLAQLATVLGVNEVILISEAWTAKKDDLPPTGYAVDAKNRGEALVLHGANATGTCYAYSATVERKKIKKHKVKRLKDRTFSEEPFQFIMSPFQKAWGCLDMEELKKNEAAVDEMGFDAAYDEVRERQTKPSGVN